MFGRKRRTSALLPASRPISRTVRGGDHGDARFVEDAVLQLHHLHGGPVAAPDLRGEGFAEQGQLFPIRRANVRRQRFAIPVLTAQRSEGDEVRELARGQPGEPAVLVDPAKREAPVALEAVPAQRGGVERLAAHGFHRIAEDRFNLSNLDRHSSSRSSSVGWIGLCRRKEKGRGLPDDPLRFRESPSGPSTGRSRCVRRGSLQTAPFAYGRSRRAACRLGYATLVHPISTPHARPAAGP